jgi:SAM-dependent methyltransferase
VLGKNGERNLEAKLIDLKQAMLSEATFDFITAMDLFEHLLDPGSAVESLDDSLKPGGYIYGRARCAEAVPDLLRLRNDFAPDFDRFATLGFKEVFRDDWLWGASSLSKKPPEPVRSYLH